MKELRCYNSKNHPEVAAAVAIAPVEVLGQVPEDIDDEIEGLVCRACGIYLEQPDPGEQAVAAVQNEPAMRDKLRNVASGAEAFTAAERDRVIAYIALRLLG